MATNKHIRFDATVSGQSVMDVLLDTRLASTLREKGRGAMTPLRGLNQGKRSSDGVLSDLLDRVLQVEEQCSRLIPASPKDRPATDSIIFTDTDADGYPSATPLAFSESPGTELLTSALKADTDAGDDVEEPTLLCTSNCPVIPENAETGLKQALEQVLHLKRQNFNKEAIDTYDPIPIDLCKASLDNFCKHYRVDVFPDFINMELMYRIPDIINLPEITVDPAALILFHCILYHGSLTLPASIAPQDWKTTRTMYVHCLRNLPAWRMRVLGTKTDLITAILLMRAAFQQCDLEFGWGMYKLVCQCVKKLNMHNLDQSFPTLFLDSELPSEGADQHRKGFWNLVLVDLFFRLLHGKPAIITADTADWRVNLPSINTAPDDTEHRASTLAFLVKSRLTLIFLRFFDKLGQDQEEEDGVVILTAGLYEEIEVLFREWSVTDSMTAYEDNDGSWWMLYDVTMTAYSSMMILSRGLVVSQSGLSVTSMVSDDMPVSALSVNISRRIIRLVSLALRKYPSPATACCVFGAFRCYVAYGCLAKHLCIIGLEYPDHFAQADLVLLEEVAQKMTTLAEKDKDLVPMARTLDVLNKSICVQWEEWRGNYQV
ncbi:hypothetical protein BFJ68_g15229 [Fusarium oxysporum]|uniref:Transcription factor domain-containing protein n=1 Tax=Fusarium oxysporum TaxID=5507 RepID=A0A420PNY4_FUSOX|nr:hypothetical protein BFJ68_g15229 [Fusarium oxysporum]